jgi:hypothetical protein
MSIARIASAIVVSAGLGLACSAALAADMPVKVKAPPAPAPEPLDMHAFFDVSFKNAYITPRGLLVTNTGLTTQILAGMAADVYKDKSGFINQVSFYGYVWNDLWSEQGHPTAGSWNEFDWAVGMTVKFWQNWKFGIEYVEFISPPGNFRIERNAEFSLGYDDSGWWGGSGFSVNPYVKLFYNFSGSSTVVVGKTDGSYDVEIGIVPTLDTKKYTGIPLTLSAPTWITVGPSEYWNAGGNVCGPALCSNDNVGVFSTGLTAKLALDAWVPGRYGKWYVKGGFQYYNIINDNLLLAQTIVGTAATFATAHEDVWVGFGGLGFSF